MSKNSAGLYNNVEKMIEEFERRAKEENGEIKVENIVQKIPANIKTQEEYNEYIYKTIEEMEKKAAETNTAQRIAFIDKDGQEKTLLIEPASMGTPEQNAMKDGSEKANLFIEDKEGNREQITKNSANEKLKDNWGLTKATLARDAIHAPGRVVSKTIGSVKEEVREGIKEFGR